HTRSKRDWSSDVCSSDRPGGAGLHALAAGDAGAGAHGVVEVEDDLGSGATIGHADDVVDLYLAAGANAQAAVDAGIEIDGHRRVADVFRGRLVRRKTARCNPELFRPAPELRVRIVTRLTGRLVGHQQLENHLLSCF